MCQDRATVASLKSFKHTRSNPPNVKKQQRTFNLCKRAAKYVTISPLSIFIEKSREAKHIILYRFLQG